MQNRLSYFCLDGKINAESLKGVIYGNPALQGGGQACQANPSGGRHSPERRRLGIAPMSWSWDAGREDVLSGCAVFQTGCVVSDTPALKGRVTTNSSLQAGCIFQMFNEDRTGRGCRLPCQVLRQPPVFSPCHENFGWTW